MITTKKIITEKLENLTKEQLNEVYEVIEKLSSSEKTIEKPSLMSELQNIKIDAPEDFSLQVGVSLGRDVSEG